MNLYVGAETDPTDRSLLAVSDEDWRRVMRLVCLRKPFQVTVYDTVTRHVVTLADEDCGLGCRCALRFVTEKENHHEEKTR